MHSYYACVDLFIAPNVHIRFALDLKSASNSLFVFHQIVFPKPSANSKGAALILAHTKMCTT